VPTDAERRAVLHAIRLGSLVDRPALVVRSGIGLDVVEAVLAEAHARGWAVERTGRVPGWSLTATGRAEGRRLLATELVEQGARPAIAAAYGTFLTVNQRFLEVCTTWQLREEGVVNDHTDEVHDSAVIAELEQLHLVVGEVVERASAALERFGDYRTRFVHALDRLRSGELEWFTRPLVDSYHTVWFELHDDLLATLGRDRSTERRDPPPDRSPEAMHASPRGRDQTGGGGTGAGATVEE
jgi:hypothetical protein